MNFKFKLSRRLAVCISSVTVTLAASSCTTSDIIAVEDALQVVQLVTLPSEITISHDQTQLFRAVGITSQNDSVAVSVIWTASGGTITGDGMYTPSRDIGDEMVVALGVDWPSLVDTSLVTVELPPITRIVITPNDVAL